METRRLLPDDAAITVALSGGLDSTVLFHLLLEAAPRHRWSVSAGHFDHRMRTGSADDAAWVAELCERHGVPCVTGRASRVPRSEADARRLRYEFLHAACLQLGSELLATAHHADDQAETVLFRLLRGSGMRGLAGIPARRDPGVVRPLLPFWRRELEAFARERGLDHRVDPGNADPSFARNRLRGQLIPSLEARGHPRLRERLHRLAELASRASAVVEQRVMEAAVPLVLEASESRIVVARTGLLAYDTSARAHLLRALAARVAKRPGRVGTHVALAFINSCSSGRRIDLAGGLSIAREFDRFIIERRSSAPARDDVLNLPDVREGEDGLWIGGRHWRVRWSWADRGQAVPDRAAAACFAVEELRPPVTLRSWEPGDRIELPSGTRKLKKLFCDRKVPRSQRSRYPLLADRDGVLWVVGLARSRRAVPGVDVGEGRVLAVRVVRER
ncbi:MAG: tRNA lysidine(34) synthetase TilS [Gemmatimonadetes bacterium]|nr:tRNA lysidine(34) synthetase TilS [Gemmatimonadota bacterium]